MTFTKDQQTYVMRTSKDEIPEMGMHRILLPTHSVTLGPANFLVFVSLAVNRQDFYSIQWMKLM